MSHIALPPAATLQSISSASTVPPAEIFKHLSPTSISEVSKLISDAFPYNNPNLEARKLLSPEALANPASYPKPGARLETFRDIGRAAADIDKLVTDLKSAK